MTTNASNKSPKGPSPTSPSPAPPRKRYPLNPPSGHDHPYAIAAHRIQALEYANKQLLADNDNLEKKVRELSAENLSLRKLALHGLIYRLDSLIKEEMAQIFPNAGRIQRWSAEVGRLRISYETLKGGKHKGGKG